MVQALKSKRIAILSSGGDAPGMNACIRSVVRSAFAEGASVLGVKKGFEGLMTGELQALSMRSVGNIIQRGGTILGSSRSADFRKKKGREKAYRCLQDWAVDALICLGGDGTLTGAKIFSEEFRIPVIGIPCTIDNDLFGTDFSIGFDTAVETAVDCIDKIRDTADSHGRVFLIEVMGKNTGHLAVEVGLAAGAEFLVLPEVPYRFSDLLSRIRQGISRGKSGSIVIVAEREQPGLVIQIGKQLEKKIQRDVKTMILGHLQRGGSPSARDRNLASRFGALSIDLLKKGKNRRMTVIQRGDYRDIGFSQVIGKSRPIDKEKVRLLGLLSQ